MRLFETIKETVTVTGVEVITKPSYTDGFMDASQCTYVPKEWTN